MQIIKETDVLIVSAVKTILLTLFILMIWMYKEKLKQNFNLLSLIISSLCFFFLIPQLSAFKENNWQLI